MRADTIGAVGRLMVGTFNDGLMEALKNAARGARTWCTPDTRARRERRPRQARRRRSYGLRGFGTVPGNEHAVARESRRNPAPARLELVSV